MNAGKSTALLQSNYNYYERGMETLLFLPKIDADSNDGKIHSRIGLTAEAHSVDSDFNFFNFGLKNRKNLIHSKLMSKIFSNKKVFLHLFEPNKYLIKNLSSKFSGHSINEVAISDFNSESDLYINSISSQSSLIEDNSFIGEEVEKIIVNTIRLDKYIVEKQIEKINLLKLDVEGYELNSLKSLGEYLNQENIEIIKVEIHFQKGDNFGSINEILNKNGFYLDGFTNTKYLKGEILFVDAYYSAKGLN